MTPPIPPMLPGADPQRGLLWSSGAPTPPKPRLIDRVFGKTEGLLGGVRRALTPTPQGFEGLLSPEAIEAARPGALDIITSPLHRKTLEQRYRDRLTGAVEGNENAQTLQMRQAMLQNRAAVQAKYGDIDPQASGPDVIARLKRMYAEYANYGDTEMLGKVGEVLKSIGGEGSKASLKEVTAYDPVAKKKVIHLTDPQTGEVKMTFDAPPDTALSPYQSELREDAYWRKVQTITNEFSKDVERAQIVAENFDAIEGVRLSAMAGDPMAQMAVIFSYMRMLDPNSAVREGEYQKAEMLRGVPDIVRNAFNKLRTGQFLSDGEQGQVQRFLDTADSIATKKMASFDNARATLMKQAERRKLNADDIVVTDYFANFRKRMEEKKRAGAAPGGAPAPASRNRLSTTYTP
jgi:hypothetical protein